jgi:hypothetical protein
VIDMLEGFERWVFLSVVPGWEVLRVLVELDCFCGEDYGDVHTFASVFPPSTSICRLTFGVSLVERPSFSKETEGTSMGNSWTDGAIFDYSQVILEIRVKVPGVDFRAVSELCFNSTCHKTEMERGIYTKVSLNSSIMVITTLGARPLRGMDRRI